MPDPTPQDHERVEIEPAETDAQAAAWLRDWCAWADDVGVGRGDYSDTPTFLEIARRLESRQEPTAQDHERARAIACTSQLCVEDFPKEDWGGVQHHSVGCDMLTEKIATAFAEQRERDARIAPALESLLKLVKIQARSLDMLDGTMMQKQSSDPHLRNSTAHKIRAVAKRLGIRGESEEIKAVEVIVKQLGGKVWG